MRTEGDAGFTLIEVLAAMLVLAIGLLGVQALAVGAARSIARADHQTEVAGVAIAAMEARQQAIRRDPAVMVSGESCYTDPGSDVDVCVDVEGAVGSARITVRAMHPRLVRDTFSITSHVYDPAIP